MPVVRFVCVRVLCARCAWRPHRGQKPQVGQQSPPGARLPVYEPLPHSPACSVRPVAACGVFVASSPSLHVVLCGCHIHLVRVRAPGGGLSRAPAPSVPFQPLVSEPPRSGGTGGLSQLPIEVAACFPSRAWELDPLQVPGRPVPKGFQADLPENPQHRLCFQGGGWGGRPRAFVLSRRLSRLRNTRPRRGP